MQVSFAKIDTYAVGNVLIDNLMNTTDKLKKPFHAVSLTEWATTTVPQIAAGSSMTCDTTLYEVVSNESIGGTAVDGTNYIKMIPAGATATVEWTQTAPVWNTSKQGWYSPTGGEETYRYLEFLITKDGSLYFKGYYYPRQYIYGVRLFTLGLSGDTSVLTTGTKINFNTVLDDTLSEYDSGNARFLSKKYGYVNINIQPCGNSGSTAGTIIIVKKNGSALYYCSYTVGATGTPIIPSNKIVLLNIGDYIEFFSNSATGITLKQNYSFIQITDVNNI
jgi:hypothetical protein